MDPQFTGWSQNVPKGAREWESAALPGRKPKTQPGDRSGLLVAFSYVWFRRSGRTGDRLGTTSPSVAQPPVLVFISQCFLPADFVMPFSSWAR
ncbi:hypothetical protein SAMN05444166_3346 [Singulisphaera sp. GP187]|nr:hypothetical protein SAMN05444166_3346 [Singulisphaera sp. GP187]